MNQDFLTKMILEAEKKGASFIEFNVSNDGVAVTSNLGTRKSTRNYAFSKKELNEIERRLKSMDGRIILFLRSVDRIELMLKDGRKGVFSKTKSKKNTFLVDHKRVPESAKKTDEWLAVQGHGVKRRTLGGVICELFSALLPTRSCRVISDGMMMSA